MPSIPPELSDHVLDFLHDDIIALRACSLTCRAWIPTSRLHMFRVISLHSLDLCTAFTRCLQKSPHLGYYVRELTVARLNSRPAVMASELLSLILPSLQRIQRLAFQLTEMLPTFIHQHRPPLKKLAFVSCSFPTFSDFVDTICCFPQLEHLHLEAVTWKTTSFDRRVQPTTLKLRKLVVGRDTDLCLLIEWLLEGTLYRDIASLSVRCTTTPDAIAVGALLEALGPSLTDLELDWFLPTMTVLTLPSALSASPCTNLRTLALHCAIPYYCSSVPWVTSFLSDINSPVVDAITLNVRLLGDADGIHWKVLERTLSERRFSDLRKLALNPNIWPTAAVVDIGELERLVRSRLPLLDARGILDFRS